jgi:hypothetical protein
VKETVASGPRLRRGPVLYEQYSEDRTRKIGARSRSVHTLSQGNVAPPLSLI